MPGSIRAKNCANRICSASFERGEFPMFKKPTLKRRVIKAFVSAVLKGKAFPKIDEDICCSRHDIFALASECDEPVPWYLCRSLGVPRGSTYSDAAIAAALREAGKPRAYFKR